MSLLSTPADKRDNPGMTRPTLPGSAGALDATPAERKFADLVALGVPPSRAAVKAGLSNGKDGAATKVMARPAVRALIRAANVARIEGGLLPIAHTTLQDVMQDRDVPASARVAAARVVYAAAGLLRPPVQTPAHDAFDPSGPAPDGAPVPELVQQQIDATRRAIDSLRQMLERAEPIDVTPGSDPSPIDL